VKWYYFLILFLVTFILGGVFGYMLHPDDSSFNFNFTHPPSSSDTVIRYIEIEKIKTVNKYLIDSVIISYTPDSLQKQIQFELAKEILK